MTKRAALIRQIEDLARDAGIDVEWAEGSNHTKVKVGDRRSTIPRHREIVDLLAQRILRQLDLPREGKG